MNRKGFTLIELLVVVLIIGVLASMAMPQYFKAVERSRMTEGVNLLSSISSAQRRKYLQINGYSQKFSGLDVAFKKGSFNDDDTVFYTKGPTGNGLDVALNGRAYAAGYVSATRAANGSASDPGLHYQYRLVRYYASDLTQCYGDNPNGQELCADFCGIDTPQETCCNDGSDSCAAPVTGNETSVH